MMRIGPMLFAVAGCALLCGQALAQPENEDSRFSFFRADSGYLRLDGRTGQVSMCTRREAGWLCQTLPEERAALEAEISRLQGDNVALKKVVLAHDLPLPAGIGPPSPPQASTGSRPSSPTDHEVNQIMGVIENVWRRLVRMIVSMQRDLLDKS